MAYFIYHPDGSNKIVTEDEYQDYLEQGWFKSPSEAEESLKNLHKTDKQKDKK